MLSNLTSSCQRIFVNIEEKELHHLAGSMPLKDMAICGWKDDRRRVDSEAASYLQQTRTCSMSLQTLPLASGFPSGSILEPS